MQGTPIERTLVTAGDHIDWITTSPDAMRFTLSLKSFQNARNCPAFFASMSVLIVRSISGFVMLPLSRYLTKPEIDLTIKTLIDRKSTRLNSSHLVISYA